MFSASLFMIGSARLFWTALALSILNHPFSLTAQEGRLKTNDPNSVILSVLEREMPAGGGYSASSGATRALQSAARVRSGKLEVAPQLAPTTYCSGATYLVFLRALEGMDPGSTISGNLAEALAVKGQPDGVGVWGRWNANGPGTACLFKELGLGRNFSSLEEARKGDFMKIFWSEAVGRREHGHSVIFLETGVKDGIETVTFWSSNVPKGYGKKTVARSRIAHAIFSRLEYPAKINQAPNLPPRNAFLASLLSTDSSIGEALGQAGAK
jgi:hypothetical protein